LTAMERELLLTLLEKTRNEPSTREALMEAIRITGDALDSFIASLLGNGAIGSDGEKISADLNQRLGLAVRAVRAGADFERVSKALGWLEFEEMAAYTFEENGFRVSRRFRFQAEGRRWEIDVLARRRPLVICAECKHWSKGLGNLTARRIVETHLEKVRVLSENAPRLMKRLGLGGWGQAVFVPVTLSLQPARNRIYRRIPVVSVFELPSFLSEFEGQMEWLAKFIVEIPPPKPRPRQTRLMK
jgi:Holliday junction resolvase-like predicted endonuclease